MENSEMSENNTEIEDINEEYDEGEKYIYTYVPCSNDDQGFDVYSQPIQCIEMLQKYPRIAEVQIKNYTEKDNHLVTKEIEIIREIPREEFLNLCTGDFIDDKGTHKWYVCGNLHREDGPAIIDSRGNQSWYQNGVLHRSDGPAIIKSNGYLAWYENGFRINRKR